MALSATVQIPNTYFSVVITNFDTTLSSLWISVYTGWETMYNPTHRILEMHLSLNNFYKKNNNE